jgi:hypothetical protein
MQIGLNNDQVTKAGSAHEPNVAASEDLPDENAENAANVNEPLKICRNEPAPFPLKSF